MLKQVWFVFAWQILNKKIVPIPTQISRTTLYRPETDREKHTHTDTRQEVKKKKPTNELCPCREYKLWQSLKFRWYILFVCARMFA